MFIQVPSEMRTAHRKQHVGLALEVVLQQAAPAHYCHIRRERLSFHYNPRVCPSSLACTGQAGRRVFFTVDPLDLDLADLGALIAHEGLHHYTDRFGRHFIVPHTCRNCRNPFERRHDPIYVEHENLRRFLRAWLRRYADDVG